MHPFDFDDSGESKEASRSELPIETGEVFDSEENKGRSGPLRKLRYSERGATCHEDTLPLSNGLRSPGKCGAGSCRRFDCAVSRSRAVPKRMVREAQGGHPLPVALPTESVGPILVLLEQLGTVQGVGLLPRSLRTRDRGLLPEAEL